MPKLNRPLMTFVLTFGMVVSLACGNSKGTSPQVQPIGLLFNRVPGDGQLDPPELPLWPSDQIDIRDVRETADGISEAFNNRFVRGIQIPTISVHHVQNAQAAVVVCPGGGYTGLSIDKEGHDTARWLNSLGITAIVLKYRCREYGCPAPMEDVRRAIALVRSQATNLDIPSDRVGVLGYSAGGHVASIAGTRFINVKIDEQEIDSRPDFMVLVYPVISMDSMITHHGSRENLLGKDPSKELVRQYSSELHVTKSTPPTFLVHAADDRAVPLENSIRMLRALQSAGVTAELALFQKGGHGFGLVSSPGPVASWPSKCERWLMRQGIINQVTAKIDKPDFSPQ